MAICKSFCGNVFVSFGKYLWVNLHNVMYDNFCVGLPNVFQHAFTSLSTVYGDACHLMHGDVLWCPMSIYVILAD